MGDRSTGRRRLGIFSYRRSFRARALTVLVTGVIVLGVIGVPAALAVSTQFELDGNATKQTHDDWNNVLGFGVPVSGSDVSHAFVPDPPSTDTTYFTGGGSKDIHDVSSWASGGSSAPDKDEITNAYAASYADGTLYFGADRFANNGDSTMGFWFFQNKVTLNGTSFNGVHKVGDILIVSDFPGGGPIGSIKIFEWNGSGITDVTPSGGGDCGSVPATAPLCAEVNGSATVAPWPYSPKSGSAGTFPTGSFLEGGINLTTVFDKVPCFSSFLAETRSSTSTDAQLKDFALGGINTCGTIKGLKYNDINGNGKKDEGEPTLQGWTITLVKNGTEIATTTTDANGNFEFDDVEPGTYTVCETIQATWFQTQPGTGADCSGHGGGNGYTITIGLGQTSSGNIFGNTQHPHLTISKTADAGTVSAGDTIGYTITVGNTGPGTAVGVKLSDTLPSNAGLSWSITAPGPSAGWGGTCAIAAGVLSCGGANGVTLAKNATLSVHVSSPTTKATCGTVSNTAETSGTNNDGAPSAGPIDIIVNCPVLTITKTADKTPVNAGDTIGYTITVINTASGTASGVKLSDTLPSNAGLSWSVESQSAGWNGTCAISIGVLTCGGADGVTLAPNASLTVHITSPTTSATCGPVVNSASATSGNDGNPSTDPITISVLCPSLGITKVADKPSVNGGDPIGFTITVSNSSAEGTGTAHNVIITDPLPTSFGLTWTIDGGTNPSVCSITSNTLTCNVGDLGRSDSFSVHVISSDTTAAACGQPVDNTAHVTLDNGPAQDASAEVNVICPPLRIKIVKGGPDLAHVGDTITYTLDVSLPPNFTEPLHNVVVSDPICDAATPPTYQSGDTNNDQILEVGETWHYTCQHVVTPSDPDPLPNTATVTGQDKLDRSTEAHDSHSVDIIHPAISITKTPNPASGNPGDTVIYTFVVKNTGDTTLFNITVVDDKLGTIGTIPQLAPGQSATLTKSTKLPTAAGDLTNVGTASGTDTLGKRVTANATAHVLVVLPVIIIPKTGTDGFGSPTALVGFLFVAVGVALATRKERGRVRPAFATSGSVAGRGIMLAAHRRSWRMRRRRGPPRRARPPWRGSQGPPMRDGP